MHFRMPPLRWISLCLLLAMVSAGCDDAKRFATVAPRLLSPSDGQVRRAFAEPSAPAEVQGVTLPPEQKHAGFDFEAAGTDEAGNLVYKVRINRNGSPSLVALEKFTPLFSLDGKSASTFVAESYFRAHPNRTPNSIQPGDEFTLTLPPGAFVVRWQEDRDERFGQPAKVREYVSERGDRLRYYLTEPFPILYETQSADDPTRGVVRFSKDLGFLLRTNRTDAMRLAQLLFRVPDPDVFQVEAMRRLLANAQLGTEMDLEIDRSRTYMDPVREAALHAVRTERVPNPERNYLTRHVFNPGQPVPYMAVEDSLGNRTNLSQLEPGRPWRIEYYWSGTIRVFYKTGSDDAMGKRDPYQLREDARWKELYQSLSGQADPPVKWGPGEPSDLDPFPTARDPRNRNPDPDAAFDYLVAGQIMVLTFTPVRFQADLKAETEFRELIQDMRDRYREPIDQAIDFVEQVQTSGVIPVKAPVPAATPDPAEKLREGTSAAPD
jgi:hypothetical protein